MPSNYLFILSFNTERCNLDCGPHGSCESGHCICEEGWQGSVCSVRVCDARCSAHGMCSNGTCLCTNGKKFILSFSCTIANIIWIKLFIALFIGIWLFLYRLEWQALHYRRLSIELQWSWSMQGKQCFGMGMSLWFRMVRCRMQHLSWARLLRPKG